MANSENPKTDKASDFSFERPTGRRDVASMRKVLDGLNRGDWVEAVFASLPYGLFRVASQARQGLSGEWMVQAWFLQSGGKGDPAKELRSLTHHRGIVAEIDETEPETEGRPC
jgi:hypothetical protein